jgi:ribosome-associated toxin RatA of RatAB toxin-antitoxin module
MKRVRVGIVLVALSLGATVFAGTARADEPVRAAAGPAKAVRYALRTPASSIDAGGARVRVRAPTSVVEKVVTDFNSYPEFIRKFERARVLGRSGKQTDVYLQVPILKGAAKVWAVVRFSPPRVQNGVRIIEGRMVKGNVDKLEATWRIKRIDERTTELSLELLIEPKLPVPGSLVTKEVASAADTAVSGSRTRAEQQASTN